jgi:hypothetical protein
VHTATFAKVQEFIVWTCCAWWLILCVNLTEPQDDSYWVEHYSRRFHEGVFE